MRYVAGSDLKSMIRQEGPISLRRAADIISQVARGLSVAHERGLVHRDIKPANILTERAGGTGETVDHAYLADFGLMKHQVSRSGLTDTGQFLGTVDYVAPEQVEGRQTDHRADVYSLGCVLYECLTGSVPYPRDSDVRPDLPSTIDEIAARAMAKRPEHRYASAGDLSRDLSEAVGAYRSSHDRPSRVVTEPTGPPPDVVRAPEPVAQDAPPRPPDAPDAGGRPPRPSRGRPSVLVIALVVALAAALAVIAFQLASGGDSNSNAGPGTTASPSGTTSPPATTGSTTPAGPVKASDLRLALSNGAFNCLSSLAIYFDLCQAADLPVEIWLARGHVFLRTAIDGRTVVIEPGTTEWNSRGVARRNCVRQITPVELLGKFYYNRGVELLKDRQFAEGINLLETSLALPPEMSEVLKSVTGASR